MALHTWHAYVLQADPGAVSVGGSKPTPLPSAALPARGVRPARGAYKTRQNQLDVVSQRGNGQCHYQRGQRAADRRERKRAIEAAINPGRARGPRRRREIKTGNQGGHQPGKGPETGLKKYPPRVGAACVPPLGTDGAFPFVPAACPLRA
jgi:hypothetical protein